MPSSSRFNKYLLPNENILLSVRQHPAFLIPSTTAAVGGLLAATAVTVVAAGNMVIEIAAWALAIFLILRSVLAAFTWSIQWIVLTADRMLLFSGLMNVKMKVLPLPKLMEMTFSRSFAGQLAGFGAFTIEADGRPLIVIDYVPYSEQIQLLLTGELFPRSVADDDDGPDRVSGVMTLLELLEAAGLDWPKTGEARPSQPKAAEPKAAEPKAEEPKAAEPKAAEPRAVGARPAQPKTAEAQPAQPKPAEPKAPGAKPARPKAAQPKPAEARGKEPEPVEPKANDS